MRNRNLYLWAGIAVGVLAILFPHIAPKFQIAHGDGNSHSSPPCDDLEDDAE